MKNTTSPSNSNQHPVTDHVASTDPGYNLPVFKQEVTLVTASNHSPSNATPATETSIDKTTAPKAQLQTDNSELSAATTSSNDQLSPLPLGSVAPPSATANTTQTVPLPSTSPSGPEPMPTYSQLLSTTWFLFKGIWWKSLLLQIGLYVLLVLLSALLFFLIFNSSFIGLLGTQDSEITPLEQSNSVYVALTAMILAIGYTLAQVGLVQAYVVLLLSAISQNSVACNTLGKAWARSAKTIGTSIFVGALAIGAGVFFGIPGLIISVAGSFALFETIEKGVGAKTAFANSVQLIQGNKRQYFSLLFVTGLVTALLYVPVLFLVYLLQMLLQSLPSEYVPILLYVLIDWTLRMVQFGTSILLNTFILAFSYNYYIQLKQRVLLNEKATVPTWMYVLGGIGLVILGIFMISIFGLALLNAVAGSL